MSYAYLYALAHSTTSTNKTPRQSKPKCYVNSKTQTYFHGRPRKWPPSRAIVAATITHRH